MTGSLDDDLPLEQRSTDDLVRLATGRDLWRKAPALAELSDRSPDAALPIARRALNDEDALVAASALRVVAAHDRPAALDHMTAVASGAPLRVLEAIVESIAVDAPVSMEERGPLLTAVARRLQGVEGDEELYLSELFFRRYPELAGPSS